MKSDIENSTRKAAVAAAQMTNQEIKRMALTDPRADQPAPALAFTNQLTQAFAEASHQAQAENARVGILPKTKNRSLKNRNAVRRGALNKAKIG